MNGLWPILAALIQKLLKAGKNVTYTEYCLSHRIGSSLERKMVQLPCILTAGKALTFSGAVSNRGNEFVLVAKTDLNLQLSLSITWNFHVLLELPILMGNDAETLKVTLENFNRVLDLLA